MGIRRLSKVLRAERLQRPNLANNYNDCRSNVFGTVSQANEIQFSRGFLFFIPTGISPGNAPGTSLKILARNSPVIHGNISPGNTPDSSQNFIEQIYFGFLHEFHLDFLQRFQQRFYLTFPQ